MLISVDPGVRMAGVAVFEDTELTAAWLARGKSWELTAFSAFCEIMQRYPKEVWSQAHIAIEVPQVYTQNKLKGDPNDLISVTLMAGCFVGFMGHRVVIHKYLPRGWTQVPKDIMGKRTQKKLSEEERSRVELPRAKSYQHNVWDGVGIGLRHLRKGRYGRKRAAANDHRVGDRGN